MQPIVQVAKGSFVAELGEGPHWDPVKEELLYVDILGQWVVRYVPKTRECFKVYIETGTVSLVIPVEGVANEYLLGIGRTITLMKWDGHSPKPTSLRTLYTVDEEEISTRRNRFNDGKCDSQGRLWAGTMGYINNSTLELHRNQGSLYSFLGEKQKGHHFGDVDISNGLCWSPDNLIMYYIDSLQHRVDAFDYDGESGTLSNRRAIYDLKENLEEDIGTGFPDGMTIDANGDLWIAIFGSGKIIHVDPIEKEKIREIVLPTERITSVAFGGPNLDILYATSACKYTDDGKIDSDASEAGALFEITNIGVEGLSAGYGFKRTL